MEPTYKEYAPHVSLQPWIDCYWSKRDPAHGADSSARVVPDGSVDIIVDVRAASSWVIGTMRRAKVIPLGAAVDFVAVRFRPGGARPLFGLTMRELLDQRVPLIDLLAQASHLGEAVAADARRRSDPADDKPASVRCLEVFLMGRLRGRAAPDARVAAAVSRLRATCGRIPVADLQRDLGVSARVLQRAFAAEVGVAPKTLARIYRVQDALRHLHRARTPQRNAAQRRARTDLQQPPRDRQDPRPVPRVRSWIEIALDGGYHDQAHFIRDFRDLVGVTPGAYLASL